MITETRDAAIRNCRFAFKCDQQWRDLAETSSEKVRSCADCGHDVFFCETDAELIDAIRMNRCVAIVQAQETDGNDLSLIQYSVGNVTIPFGP